MANVAAFAKNGYIAGRSGNRFEPQANITRAEVVKLLDNMISDYITESGTVTPKGTGIVIVKASGVTLGELVSIDYNWGELHLCSPTHYEMDPPCMARASAAPTAMDIEPDDIDVSDSVTFVWEIR